MTTRFRASLAIDPMEKERNGSSIAVRLDTSHLADVAELERLCFAEPWSENSLSLLLRDGGVGFVVCEGDRAVAYGGMLCVAGEGQITNVAVHPDARRRGYGRTVMQALLGYAEEKALFEISLEVRESNEAAIALYRALGFAVCGVRRNFYQRPTENALVMLWHRENGSDCM